MDDLLKDAQPVQCAKPVIGEAYVKGKWVSALILPNPSEDTFNAVLTESALTIGRDMVGTHFYNLTSQEVRVLV